MNRLRMHAPVRIGLGAVVCLATLSNSAAQAQDIKATVVVQTAGQSPMSMDYTATDEGVRLDMTQPQQMSMVWLPGPPPIMRMMQGGGCMEMGEQAFQMMQQLQQGTVDTNDFDIADLSFEPTTDTATIGQWTATRVNVTGFAGGQEGAVWVADDLETGLFELFAQMSEALEALQMGGNNPSQQMAGLQALQSMPGLPDGGVVQLMTSDPSGTTTVSLESLMEGAYGSALDPPASGCQEMPSLGNLGGLPE